MTEQISVIVEGKEDFRFIQDFIDFHFKKQLARNSFIEIGGKSETIHLSQAKIQTSTDSGKLNIVVFDADDNDYQSTLAKLKAKGQELLLTFDNIFLFPNNNSKGNLESLLKDSVTKGNEKLFECIEAYASCKAALNLKNPRPIDEKEKIRIYQGSFVEPNRVKGSERSYLDNNIWDLNSPMLIPLKEFLGEFFN
jgi:hypothetical protein